MNYFVKGEKLMKKVYLFCSAGMSTSLLASNMQKVANDHNLPVEVKAFPLDKIDEIYNREHPECILLGPQVKFLLKDTAERYKDKDVAIGVIDRSDYGMMDGEKVLKAAIKLIKQK